MRPITRLAPCAILLLSFGASAAPPSDEATLAVRALVEEGLVKPLEEREGQRSKFSRARPPPEERRVRLLDAAATKDARGKAFRSFAVDARRSLFAADDGWSENDIVGCVYEDDGAMFVKVGDSYRPARLLLGKKSKRAPATVCQPAPAANPKLASSSAPSSR